MRLERCGFMVLAVTADGASPNRAFMNIHKPNSSDPFNSPTRCSIHSLSTSDISILYHTLLTY